MKNLFTKTLLIGGIAGLVFSGCEGYLQDRRSTEDLDAIHQKEIALHENYLKKQEDFSKRLDAQSKHQDSLFEEAYLLEKDIEAYKKLEKKIKDNYTKEEIDAYNKINKEVEIYRKNRLYKE